jgi:hypothetical protein
MLRSIIAVLAGYVAMAITVLVIFRFVTQFVTIEPGPGLLIPNAILGLGAALLGGYVTARVAIVNKAAHVLALIVVVLVGGIASMIFFAGQEPFAFQLSNTVVGVLGVYLGGLLQLRNTSAS